MQQTIFARSAPIITRMRPIDCKFPVSFSVSGGDHKKPLKAFIPFSTSMLAKVIYFINFYFELKNELIESIA